jgi:hypothetical protein
MSLAASLTRDIDASSHTVRGSEKIPFMSWHPSADVIPAKAGTHFAMDRKKAKWMLAFAA